MAGKEALRLTRLEKEYYDPHKGRRVRRVYERRPPWWKRVLQMTIVVAASMLIGVALSRLL